jgi:hypothetical protein
MVILHEMVHVCQYKKEGVFKFLLKYLYHYLKAIINKEPTYARAIPYEVEAYDLQRDFTRLLDDNLSAPIDRRFEKWLYLHYELLEKIAYNKEEAILWKTYA